MSENSAWDPKILRKPAHLTGMIAQAVENGCEREAIGNLVKMLIDLPPIDTKNGAQTTAGDVTDDALRHHIPSPTTSPQENGDNVEREGEKPTVETGTDDQSTSHVEAVKRNVRHCAFCLKICDDPAKLCGGCKRRAYCSKECQKADWSVTSKGQGHKNWCGKYECGEEDVEWEVVPVPGKGLGIVAKKFMPSKYRIIVEPVFTHPSDHPAIMDLAPEGKSLEYKFLHNALGGDPARDSGKDYVGLRISRVNHSCKPNAGHNYDEIARVEILFALRDIHAGEEICFGYRSFSSLHPQRPTFGMGSAEDEFNLHQSLLQTKWGIHCPSDCFCNDTKARQLVVRGRELYISMHNLARRSQIEAALECAEKLLKIHDELELSWIAKANCHFIAFELASLDCKKLPIALKHIQAIYDVYLAVCPYSRSTGDYKNMLEKTKREVSTMQQRQKRGQQR